jgi:hypothetical protein
MYPELARIRFKDPNQPFQRIVQLLGLLAAVIDKLENWLGGDALRFEFVFLQPDGEWALRHEYELLEMMLCEKIECDLVHLYPARATRESAFVNRSDGRRKTRESEHRISVRTEAELVEYCREQSRSSMCHVLLTSLKERTLDINGVAVSSMNLRHEYPILMHQGLDEPESMEWESALERILQLWV